MSVETNNLSCYMCNDVFIKCIIAIYKTGGAVTVDMCDSGKLVVVYRLVV